MVCNKLDNQKSSPKRIINKSNIDSKTSKKCKGFYKIAEEKSCDVEEDEKGSCVSKKKKFK